ncbi:glycosyltransferase [Actinocrispum sp. NPDC049592]|uniref:glycosyltransferase n=1 Tax=Actinocrispum sp. NPDC049592 TaxID=3154835 RepID=UPI003429601C
MDRAMAVWPAAWDVAVLIVAHNGEDRIKAAVETAAHMVPLDCVFLVSDASSDRTVDLAEQCGVQLAETMRPLGRTGSFAAGLDAFRLLDRFEFVVLIDADTSLDLHYLEQAMALFADPSVAAVDGRTSLPCKGVLAAYRSRMYALAEWGPSRSRSVPGVARIYRSSVLREVTPDDFGAVHEIFSKGLGRVVFCPTARVFPPQAGRFGEHWAQIRAWATSFLVVRRVLPVALSPALLLPALISPWLLLVSLCVMAVDYGVTIAVALRQREPRYFVPGLVFPFLRVVDAWVALSVLRHSPQAEWVQFRAARPRVPLVQWVLVVAAAGLVAGRVVLSLVRVPAAGVEPSIVDAAYATSSGIDGPSAGTPLAFTSWQLSGYAGVTGAFRRYASTLTGARELSVVAVVMMLLGLVWVMRLVRIRVWVVAIALGMLAVSGVAVTALTGMSPGLLGAAWASLAAAAGLAALPRPRAFLVFLAAGLALLALATAPLLLVPVGAGFAVWFAISHRWRLVGAAVVVTAGLGYFLWRSGFVSGGVLSPGQRYALLGVVAGAVVGGLIVGWARPVAAGVLAGALLAGLLDASVLVPALVAGAAVLVAAAVDEAVSRPVLWLVPGTAVAGSMATVLWMPAAVPSDHSGLSSWMTAALDRDVRVAVPPGVWSDVVRDRPGFPAPAVGAGSGVEVARFGFPVVLPVPVEYLSSASRASAGRQLANNVRLHTPAEVRSALEEGRVDLVAMTVLAQLCRDHDVSVSWTGKPAPEAGSALPDRVVVVSAVDGRPAGDDLVDWLRAQLPPYAPSAVRLDSDGAVLSWRIPLLPAQAAN